jgi:hypothetical protein
MEKEDNSNAVIIDDKEYKIEDFTEEQTYQVRQIRDLQTKSNNLRFQIDQLQTAEKAFSSALVASLTSEGKTEEKKDK